MSNNIIKKCIAYIRVSSLKDEQSESLENQLLGIKNFLKRQGLLKFF